MIEENDKQKVSQRSKKHKLRILNQPYIRMGLDKGGGRMWRRKGCPRCQGDIFIDEDVGSKYLKCLQCGYEKEVVPEPLGISHRGIKKGRVSALPF